MNFQGALARRDWDVREEGHFERTSGDKNNPFTLRKNKLRPRVEKNISQSCHSFACIIHAESTMHSLLNFRAVPFVLSYLLIGVESKSCKGLI